MVQLQAFIGAMGAALSYVSLLEVSASATCSSTGESQPTNRCLENEPHPLLTDAAGTCIATVLAASCPSIRHLGMDGGVGVAACKAFGNLCPLLTSWELLDAQHMQKAMVQVIVREQLLPRVHTIRHTMDPYHCDQGLILSLCDSTTLRHLDLGDCDPCEEVWQALPSWLEVLEIGQFRRGGSPPTHLTLWNLRRLSLHHSKMDITCLTNILCAAPVLQHLAGSSSRQNGGCLVITACTDAEIELTMQLGQRLKAGLVLENLEVCLDHRRAILYEPSVQDATDEAWWFRNSAVGMRELLCRLPSLPGITTCQLRYHSYCTNLQASPPYTVSGDSIPPENHIHDNIDGRGVGDEHAPNSLSYIARILPDLIDLRMDWRCEGTDAVSEVLHLSVGSSVRKIVWRGLGQREDNQAALAQLICRTPSLRQVVHDACPQVQDDHGLCAMLCAARSPAVSAHGGQGAHGVANDVWVVGEQLGDFCQHWHLQGHATIHDLLDVGRLSF